MNLCFYRPKWLCGRYHAPSHSAIAYNLLSGISYFFEDESADIIGRILKIQSPAALELSAVGAEDISDEDLSEFLQSLVELGLLTTTLPDNKYTKEYRQQLVNMRKLTGLTVVNSGNKSNCENLYAARTGCGAVNVMLELTYNCSEKCVHCYNPGASRNNYEAEHRSVDNPLTWIDYRRIIDELYEEGVCRICLSGGDPFSYPYIWNLMEYLHLRGIAFDVYTNGQRLHNQVDRLAELFPCVVGISIYSLNVEVHDRITRIPGSLNRTLKTFHDLCRHSIPVEVKCCLMKLNPGEYVEVADLSHKNGAAFQLEAAIFDSMDGDKCASQILRLSDAQFQLVCQDPLNPLFIDESNNYGKIDLKEYDNLCHAGKSSFTITPSGDVVPCSSFHMSMGNLRNSSLSKILNNSSVRMKWLNVTLSDYHECGKHEYCYYCKPCPRLNYASTGNYLKASENCCFIAKNRWTLSKSIQSGKVEDVIDVRKKLKKSAELFSTDTIHHIY